MNFTQETFLNLSHIDSVKYQHNTFSRRKTFQFIVYCSFLYQGEGDGVNMHGGIIYSGGVGVGVGGYVTGKGEVCLLTLLVAYCVLSKGGVLC